MLKKMKRKTYHNFLIVKNLLMKEKGYDDSTASQLAHLIFGNYELDNARTIQEYYDFILTREEFELQCGKDA